MSTPTAAAMRAAERLHKRELLTFFQDIRTAARLIDRETGLPELIAALKVAEVHMGWGDCTLENVHKMIRAAIQKAEGRS